MLLLASWTTKKSRKAYENTLGLNLIDKFTLCKFSAIHTIFLFLLFFNHLNTGYMLTGEYCFSLLFFWVICFRRGEALYFWRFFDIFFQVSAKGFRVRSLIYATKPGVWTEVWSIFVSIVVPLKFPMNTCVVLEADESSIRKIKYWIKNLTVA